jgi:hypothetical protein
MFFWVYKFLSMIHCTLFHDSDPFYSFDLEGSTFFLGVEVENVFQSLKDSFMTIDGHNFGSSWRNLWTHVMFVFVQRIFIITLMDFFNHCWSLFHHGLRFPWIFIRDFPRFHSFDSILVVVDCLMKMAHFIPCNKSITGEMTLKLFFNHVFHYHRFFENIGFDYGLQFASKY